ncbi:MAG: hypothetical protein HY236_08580 [Acidobacteria bacterium]|nr:hypothetical protein [Acidobacteriota bacterium]
MKQKLLPLLGFLLLASVYLVYWNDAEYVVDDWLHFDFYRQAEGAGLREHLHVLKLLFDNQLYRGVQVFWLSHWINCFLVWIFGYAPKIAFGLMVLLHALSAWLFYLLLARLGVNRRIAFLAGAGLVLIPTAHGPLFWPLNCSFFVWPMFFLVIYLLQALQVLEEDRLRRGAAVKLVLLTLLTLFAGSPAFALLVLSLPWMAWCFFGRQRIRMALPVTALNWAVVAIALLLYPPLQGHNRPPKQLREQRYFYTYEKFSVNLSVTRMHLVNLTGLTTRSYYHVLRSPSPAVVGLLVALLVFLMAWRIDPSPGPSRLFRAGIFAAGMWVLAYLPIMFLHTKTLRHYYTFSPFLSLLVVLPAGVGLTSNSGRAWGVAWGAVLCGYFAACTVAETRQCWIPQSRHTQLVKHALAGLKNLSPGEWVIVPGVPLVVGTAPYFSIGGAPYDALFAKYVTGVPNLKFAREIVLENGRLRFFHRYFMKDTSPEELHRSHVLAPDPDGGYSARRYVAYEREPDRFQLLPLKGSDPPASGGGLLTRDQLRPLEKEIQFPKPFQHGHIEYLHY